ncbi:MAG: Hsp20/alpha crystallin family protein, partial [Thermoplasmata archaeon]
IRARWSEERVEPEGRFEWRESHFYELDRKIAFPEYVNPDTARAMAKGNILKIMVMKEEATNASGISIPAFIK